MPHLSREDYRREYRLTPEQKIYQQLWPALAELQRGRKPIPVMGIGFKGAPRVREDGRARVTPLSWERPVVAPEDLVCVTLTPIPRRLFGGDAAKVKGAFRLELAERKAAWEDGEVVFASPSYCVDFARSPLQDYPATRFVRFDPQSLGNQIEAARGQEGRELRSPIAGDFCSLKDERAVRLYVGEALVYCFPRDAMDGVELTPDREVAAGEVVARLHGRVEYEEALFRRKGGTLRPRIEQIRFDVLAASRREHLFRMANAMLEQMLGHVRLAELRPRAIPFEEFCPRLLLRFSRQELAQMREMGWEPSPLFKARLRQAASPTGGGLTIHCPVNGTCHGLERRGPHKALRFGTEAGPRWLGLPSCAELQISFDFPVGERDPVRVTKGEILGTYVPVEFYDRYETLEDMSCGGLAAVEDAFLESQALEDANGVLLEADLVRSVEKYASGRMLDMRPVLPFLDERDGTAVALVPCPDVRDLGRRAHGVRIDASPSLPLSPPSPAPRAKQAASA